MTRSMNFQEKKNFHPVVERLHPVFKSLYQLVCYEPEIVLSSYRPSTHKSRDLPPIAGLSFPKFSKEGKKR